MHCRVNFHLCTLPDFATKEKGIMWLETINGRIAFWHRQIKPDNLPAIADVYYFIAVRFKRMQEDWVLFKLMLAPIEWNKRQIVIKIMSFTGNKKVSMSKGWEVILYLYT